MKTQAKELSIGDVVRDPEGHRSAVGINRSGASAWAKVYAIMSAPMEPEVRFLYEYVDADGKPTGRCDRASYKQEAPLEWRSDS